MKTIYSAGLAICLLLLSGCATPAAFQVREGSDPENVDKEVRFRTTYYFRVFDYCFDEKNGDQPISDSLYRFIMTGKANAYTNSVRFESGTLRDFEIDPFGASVERADSGAIRFVSQTEAARRARFDSALKDIATLQNLKSGFVEPEDTALRTVIDEQIKALITVPAAAKGKENGNELDNADACGAASQFRRGFQIVGPQGLRTFDQSERLLMAMTSDSQPLISTLQESSQRVLQSREEEVNESDLLVPFLTEQLRVNRINAAIKDKENDAGTLIDKLKSELAPETKDDGEG